MNIKINGKAPLVIDAIAVTQVYTEGGSLASEKKEQYVLLSALPEELRKRVILACQAIANSI